MKCLNLAAAAALPLIAAGPGAEPIMFSMQCLSPQREVVKAYSDIGDPNAPWSGRHVDQFGGLAYQLQMMQSGSSLTVSGKASCLKIVDARRGVTEGFEDREIRTVIPLGEAVSLKLDGWTLTIGARAVSAL